MSKQDNRATASPPPVGLVARWLEIERGSGRPLVDVLAELNEACGTRYKHNWLAQIRLRPSQNLPLTVRQFMMRRVLPVLLDEAGMPATPKKIDSLVVNLT